MFTPLDALTAEDAYRRERLLALCLHPSTGWRRWRTARRARTRAGSPAPSERDAPADAACGGDRRRHAAALAADGC